MEPVRTAPPADPDFEPTGGRRPIRIDPDLKDSQRLLANPFLAVAGLIAWFVGFREAIFAKDLPIVLLLLAGLAGVACLLQVHCLDCGKTEVFFRWKRHLCERVLARKLAGRPRRFRGPDPTKQLILWGYAILVVAFLCGIVLRARR